MDFESVDTDGVSCVDGPVQTSLNKIEAELCLYLEIPHVRSNIIQNVPVLTNMLHIELAVPQHLRGCSRLVKILKGQILTA